MGFLSDLFGSKPTVPSLPALNLGTEQQNAIAGNIKSLPASEQLVGAANQFNQSQIQSMLEKAIPNYNAITGQAGSTIDSLLKGEIPVDVSAAVQNSDAAKALGGGYGGSGMHGDLVARDLGLTSLDLVTKGLTSAESWIGMMDKLYAPGTVNVSSMFVTPAQQASFDVEERNSQFQRSWMQNQISAMPDPTTKGLWNFGWGIVDNVLAAYTGGMVGTSGGANGGGLGQV